MSTASSGRDPVLFISVDPSSQILHRDRESVRNHCGYTESYVLLNRLFIAVLGVVLSWYFLFSTNPATARLDL